MVSDSGCVGVRLTAYEIGAKYGSGGLTAEAAGFYYDYKNLQNGFYLIGATVLSNAASARARSLEGSLSYKLPDGLEISAAGAYVNAKYLDYGAAGFFTPRFIPDNDGDGRAKFNGFSTTQTANAAGNQMQRILKLSGTLAARYNTALAGGILAISGNLNHTRVSTSMRAISSASGGVRPRRCTRAMDRPEWALHRSPLRGQPPGSDLPAPNRR